MEPLAGVTYVNRGIEHKKGSVATNTNAWVCPGGWGGGTCELFGCMAILWPCVKAGPSHHACELTEK